MLTIGTLAAPQAQASRLLVSSALNSSLLRYDGQTGAFTDTFAPTASGGLNYPEGMAFGADGNLYVRSSGSILKFNGVTGISMGTFATSNGQDPSSYAFQVRLDGGSFIATPATGGLDGPTGIVFGPDGSLFVSSYGTILRYSGLNGTPLGTFAAGNGLFNATGVTFGPDGNLYVSNYPGSTVLKYSGSNGAFLGTFVAGGSGGLDRPIGLTFGPDGNLYVCSYNTNSVLRYNGTTGAFMGAFTTGGGLNGPTGLTFGPDSNLYVASYGSSSIPRYNGTTGAFMNYFAAPGSNGLSGPFSVCFYIEPPTNLTASGPTISQISLSWINNSPDDTGVEIDRKVGSGAYSVVAVVSPSTTNYNDTGLTPGTPYTYRVRAVSNSLVSGFSPESSATTLPGTPSAPTSLTAAASASNWNQINLSWSGDGSNATNYEIYRRTGASAYALIGTVLPNITTYSDNAANADTLYTYEVRAVNSNFASAYTNEASARTIQSPPTAPSSLTATAAPLNWTQITLKWAVTLSTATAIEIYRKTGTSASTSAYALVGLVVPTATSFTDNTVSAGTTYTYRVRTANNYWPSAYTSGATATTIQSPPAAPSGLTATPAPLTWTQITLKWTVTPSNATAIEIYRKTGTSASTSPYALVGLVVPTATSFTDNTVSAGTTYTYRVRTANNYWPSGYTSEASATTIQSPPAAPSGLTATAPALNWTQINLSWTVTPSNATAIEIYRKTGTSASTSAYALVGLVVPTATSFTDSTVSAGTTYTYRVRTANNNWPSGYTNEATAATIQSPPAAPTGLTATAVPLFWTQITLSWTVTPSTATAIEIYRKTGTSASTSAYALVGLVVPTATGFSDNTASAGTTYTYRVRTANNNWPSGYTNEATATTIQSPPAAPTGLTATAVSSTQISLTWVDNSTNATAIEIYRKTGDGTYTLAGLVVPGTTTFVDSGMSPNTSYTYRVRTANNNWPSGYTAEVTVTTGP